MENIVGTPLANEAVRELRSMGLVDVKSQEIHSDWADFIIEYNFPHPMSQDRSSGVVFTNNGFVKEATIRTPMIEPHSPTVRDLSRLEGVLNEGYIIEYAPYSGTRNLSRPHVEYEPVGEELNYRLNEYVEDVRRVKELF